MIKSLRKKEVLYLILQVVIALIAFLFVQVKYYEYYEKENEDKVQIYGRDIKNQIEKDMNIDVMILYSINQLILENNTKKASEVVNTFLQDQDYMVWQIYVDKKEMSGIKNIYSKNGKVGLSLRDRLEIQNIIKEEISREAMSPVKAKILQLGEREDSVIIATYKLDNVNKKSAVLVSIIDVKRYFDQLRSKKDMDKYCIHLEDERGKHIYISDKNKHGHIYNGVVEIAGKKLKLGMSNTQKTENELSRSFAYSIVLFFIVVFLLVYMQAKLLGKNLRIDELRDLQEQLGIKEERFRMAVEGVNDIVWEWNFENRNTYFSDRWNELIGIDIDVQEDILVLIERIIHKDDLVGFFSEFEKFKEGKVDTFHYEFRIETKDGYRWFGIKGNGLREDSGAILKMYGSLSDINERKKTEEILRYRAYFDSLTSLPNKLNAMEYINKEISLYPDSQFWVIYMNLDKFKRINETMGYDYGDQLLKVVGALLKVEMKKGDFLARIGGDEFLMILKSLEFDEVINKLEELIKLFENPFEVGAKTVYISMTLGVSNYPEDGNDAEILMKNADIALVKEKQDGNKKYRIFEAVMVEEIVKRAELEKDIREAIRNKEFIIYYQPQLDLKTLKVKGMEALVRWNSPKHGFVSPKDFIPITEETGLIVPLGNWIIGEVFKQSRLWKEKKLNEFRIGINISTIQLKNDNFFKEICRMAKEENIDPESIELEITESIFMEDIDYNAKLLEQLGNMGFRISIDDFGTGYSSFNYIKKLPINTLKIDKSFVDTITTSYSDKSITDAMINMAKKMGIETIAEGVEEESQVEILKTLGCDIMQGYYGGKPMDSNDAEEYVKNRMS